MAKPKPEQPIVIRCPNCKQTGEPNYNETTHRYVCALCATPVDVQVIIEKKKRGGNKDRGWQAGSRRM